MTPRDDLMDMKKILAVGIIFLFIGVAVAPSINQSVVKASTDDELVEVTTQACGIQGYGDTTVNLTREQYQYLEEYLVEFRARLNQTTTKEELIMLYKEAIGELNYYGLLPKGMSISLAESLVIGNALFDSHPGFFKRFSMPYYDIENMKCFVYAEGVGDVRPLWFYPILEAGLRILFKLADIGGIYPLVRLLFIFGILMYRVVPLFYTFTPIHIFTDIWLYHGENQKLTTISFLPYKIFKGDTDNDYELFGYTGLKVMTPEVLYFYGRTFFVINQN